MSPSFSHFIDVFTYAAAILAFSVGAWRAPPSCVAAMYCLFPLKQLGQSSIELLQSHPATTNILIGAIVVVATLRNWRTLILRFWHRPASYFLAASLYFYALLSTGWSLAPDEALHRWGSAWPYLVTAIFLAPLSISSTCEFRTALRWLTWIGGLLSLAMLISGDWGSRGLVVDGISGDFETNPLAIAATAGAVAIAALVPRATGSSSLIHAPLAILASISSIFLIIRSGSRGELFAALAAIALVSPLRFNITKARDVAAIALLTALISVGLVVGLSQYRGGGDARWSQSVVSADTEGRLEMATTLLRRWSKSDAGLVFGLGNSSSFDSRVVGFYPHVLPAEILGEEGLVGFLLLLALLVRAGRDGLHGWKSSAHDSDVRATVAAAIALAVFSLVVSCKEGNLLSNYIFFTALTNISRISKEARVDTFEAPKAAAIRLQNLLR